MAAGAKKPKTKTKRGKQKGSSIDPKKLSQRYRSIAKEVLRLEVLDGERQGDSPDEITSKPGPPASDKAIAKAEKKRKRTFHPAYRAFLKTFDGWHHFSWGTSLYGTKELSSGSTYEEDSEVFEYGDPLPKELADGLLIGFSENDASRVILLESGEVVDWMYEEEARYPDLASYLDSRRTTLLEMAESAREAVSTTEAEWDPKQRAAEDKALEKELAKVLESASRSTSGKASSKKKAKHAKGSVARASSNGAPGTSASVKEVKPSELVLRKGREIVAEVGLSLVLYLGAAPTKDEVLASFRAFRKRFPVKGAMAWAPAQAMTFSTNDAKSADDESFASALTIDDQGHFGLRATITPSGKKRTDTKNTYFFNLRAIPPLESEGEDEEKATAGASTNEKTPRASFFEVFVPHHEDPSALEALCYDLVDILPVRSGHGGWFAHVWDDEVTPDPWDTVFQWCRRFFGLEVAHVDGWLVAARKRLRGANWLTVLGHPFAKVLDKAKALAPFRRGATGGIARHEGRYGVVLRAGASPPLGDVARGELPASICEVARAIEPLTLASFAKSGMFSVGGVFFSTFTDELPGDFVDHHATALFLRRFTDPDGFLGPTPREHGEALLEALATATKNQRWLKEWRAKVKKGEEGFSDILNALYNASCGATTTDLGIEALELAAQFPDWALPHVYNNLLYGYLGRKRYADGLRVMDVALRAAKNNPPTYHNAACIYAYCGKIDEAFECVRLAKESGYTDLEKMRTDPDLAVVAKKKGKAWDALFGAPPPSPLGTATSKPKKKKTGAQKK